MCAIEGLLYGNDGASVDSLTALVEPSQPLAS
jgi:hypothetical protein